MCNSEQQNVHQLAFSLVLPRSPGWGFAQFARWHSLTTQIGMSGPTRVQVVFFTDNCLTGNALQLPKTKKCMYAVIIEKREYRMRVTVLGSGIVQVPLLPLPPAWTPGLILHEGPQWSQALWNTTNEMLKTMNRGIETLPDITHKKIIPRTLDR